LPDPIDFNEQLHEAVALFKLHDLSAANSIDAMGGRQCVPPMPL
jgi:hypothetical protein